MAASPKLVASSKVTVVDFGVVESGICERVTENVGRSLAFTMLVAETIFDLPNDELTDHIVDGGGDRGIDIIFIDHEHRRINIGSCKTVASFKNSQKFFPADEIDKIISFVDDLLLARESSFADCNPRLRSKLEEVWEIFGNEEYEIAVHLFSNQLTLPRDARVRLTEVLHRNNVKLFEYGLFEISHGLVRATKPRFKKTLLPIGDAPLTVSDTDRRALVVRVKLSDIAGFTNRGGRFDERLVWQNVRYFLGLNNDVNREIRSTLQGGKAEDFWYLNSGLTIVCDQITSLANGHHPLTLINPQIVNGCQTAAVIHSVAFDSIGGVQDGSVQVRLIETTDTKFIEEIALASNTQSRILGRDLRANELFQQQIAATLRPRGIFYRRKRGEVPPDRGMIVIDAARAGQVVLAYACGEPAKSKTTSNEIFGDLYAEAFNPGMVTPEIIAAGHTCHRLVMEERKKAIGWQTSISRESYDEAWLIEGHFHVLFAVGELMRRAGISLSDEVRAVSLLPDAMAIVKEFVSRHQKVSFYRLFRLQQSKDDLARLIEESGSAELSIPVQLNLPFA